MRNGGFQNNVTRILVNGAVWFTFFITERLKRLHVPGRDAVYYITVRLQYRCHCVYVVKFWLEKT
jgi:hypothetical protein